MGLTTLKRHSYLLDGSIYDIVICILPYPGERGRKEEQEGEYIVQRGGAESRDYFFLSLIEKVGTMGVLKLAYNLKSFVLSLISVYV